MRNRAETTSALIVYLLLAGLPVTIASQSKWGASKEYENQQYGYSVSFPATAMVKYSKPPNPNHGLAVYLSADKNRYVWVDGSYNAMEYASVEEIVSADLEKGEKILSIDKVVLGNLPALRIRTSSRKKGDTQLIHETVTCLRKREKGTSIIYSIGLESDLDHAAQDSVALNKIVSSFVLKPLHK